MSLLDTSDKVFWHNFVQFYETWFQGRSFSNIAEIGLFKGNSMRWLLQRFPSAELYGADIMPVQPEWPVDPRFHFSQLDQSDIPKLKAFLQQQAFDLIIEDGSHFPQHQALALILGIQALKPGGLYILEDIHTSHPEHAMAQALVQQSGKPHVGTAMSVLLAIDHYKRIGVEVDEAKAAAIARDSIINEIDVLFLAKRIGRISLYKRTNLPDYCYSCGATDFDFSAYKCRCGIDVFSDADSMSFVIEKAA